MAAPSAFRQSIAAIASLGTAVAVGGATACTSRGNQPPVTNTSAATRSIALVVVNHDISGSAARPHDWSGYVPTNIRNDGDRPVVLDRIEPLSPTGGLEVDSIHIVGPFAESVEQATGEGWPPEYGHGVDQTVWSIPESAMRKAPGLTIPDASTASTTAPPPFPGEPSVIAPDDPNSVSVMFKARLRAGTDQGELPGYDVYYHEVGGANGVLEVRTPFRICELELLSNGCVR